jgi:hypothetical protein
MTLGNMRTNGVRWLSVSCFLCHHGAVLAVDRWPDDAPVPSFGPRMVCTCGIVGADARPNWTERPARPSLTGAQWGGGRRRSMPHSGPSVGKAVPADARISQGPSTVPRTTSSPASARGKQEPNAAMKPLLHKTGLPHFDQESFTKGLSDGFRGYVWWTGPGIEPLSYASGYRESGVRNPRTESRIGRRGDAPSLDEVMAALRAEYEAWQTGAG